MHARTTRLAPPLLIGLCRPASSAELAPDKRRRHMFALASDHERPARERCELVALPPHHGDWPVWVCCQPNTPKVMHRKPRGPLCDKSSIPWAYIVLEISYLEHAAPCSTPAWGARAIHLGLGVEPGFGFFWARAPFFLFFFLIIEPRPER